MKYFSVIVAFVFVFLSCVPANSFEARVVRVKDGDTFVARIKQRKEDIRLYGVDTPEKDQWFGSASTRAVKTAINGETVSIHKMGVDPYDRIVALVEFKGKSLNAELVRKGYAWVYDYFCNAGVCSDWKTLEREARNDNRGLWEKDDVIPPWKFRKQNK